MYIQHMHPTAETPEATTEALSALYRACVRKLHAAACPPQRGTPAPNAQ